MTGAVGGLSADDDAGDDRDGAWDGDWDVETVAVHAGRPDRDPGAPLNPPIVAASSFHAEGRYEYAREESPTTSALEAAVGALEHGTGVAFASGMAAANAMLDLLPPGAVVVAPSAAYTGVASRLRELETRGSIVLRIVDADDTTAVTAAVDGASLLWLESPTNPLLQVADLPACIAAARAAGARVLVDNTFATPVRQNPLLLGADVVMHSVTKSLAGHSDLVLGALVTADDTLAESLVARRVLMGAAPGALDCYLALRGIRTLALRVDRAEASAMTITDRLREHPSVTRVRYPGFGTIAAIEVAAGADGSAADTADAVCRATRVWTYATSLGGVESLLERRRRWPAEVVAVPEGLVRLSFGIEAAEDLWRDLDRALRVAVC